jgi:hypothetical protein
MADVVCDNISAKALKDGSLERSEDLSPALKPENVKPIPGDIT